MEYLEWKTKGRGKGSHLSHHARVCLQHLELHHEGRVAELLAQRGVAREAPDQIRTEGLGEGAPRACVSSSSFFSILRLVPFPAFPLFFFFFFFQLLDFFSTCRCFSLFPGAVGLARGFGGLGFFHVRETRHQRGVAGAQNQPPLVPARDEYAHQRSGDASFPREWGFCH